MGEMEQKLKPHKGWEITKTTVYRTKRHRTEVERPTLIELKAVINELERCNNELSKGVPPVEED